MQPSLEKLRKFFRLEHENGYSNSAIIGGLEKILDFWEGEARLDGLEEQVIQSVEQRLRSYDGLNPQSRAEALKGLWKRIGETYPDAAQKTAPIPRARRTETTPSRPAQAQVERSRRGAQTRPAPVSRAEAAPGGKHSQTPAALNAALTVLQGVGPKHATTLESLGMRTLGDMLYYFPRRYEDYSQLKPIKSLWYGEQVTVIGTVQSVYTRPIRRGAATIVEAILGDGTGSLRLSWFNQPWMANRLREGMQISVSGKVDQYLGRLVMNQPDWEPIEIEHLHTNRIVPIYPLTGRLTQKWLRGLMNQVITYWAPTVVDSIPEGMRSSAGLLPLGQALMQIHFPDSQEQLKAARQRLAFDEIFFLQMGVLQQKRDWQQAAARRFSVSDEWLGVCTTNLPFTLTSAQQRVISELRTDLDSGKPMNRLLQGDVGSGKTVIAALVAGIIATHNAQTAVMAPTGILAEQHYRSFTAGR
jgi:ATP-dependent DNA helicase RecG